MCRRMAGRERGNIGFKEGGEGGMHRWRGRSEQRGSEKRTDWMIKLGVREGTDRRKRRGRKKGERQKRKGGMKGTNGGEKRGKGRREGEVSKDLWENEV